MALKRFTSILSGKRNPFDRGQPEPEDIDGDTPEANIARSVKLFCESGTADSTVEQGEEVLQLPVIVEAAESSPAAAAVAATHIRKFLSQQHNASRPNVQYNSIMLMRILADNPGPTFTRNVDAKFVSTVKDVLRNCRDPSVQQILRETLLTMYREKAYDTNLANLFAMWQKEGGMVGNVPGPTTTVASGPMPSWNGTSTQRSGYQAVRPKKLPAPAELAQRIEEARTSAKLLQQLVQSTPQADLRSNDLIKEFTERCQSAQRSVQGYISADDPMPDDDTMQTLIETSEQLSLALSKHSRALLQARRAAADSGRPSPSQTPPLLPARPEEQSDRAQLSTTYAPSGYSPELSTYSPPPIPPSSIPRREVMTKYPPPDTSYTYSPPPIPPPSKLAGPIDEDPFADEHATGDIDELRKVLAPPGLRPGIQNLTSSYVRRQDDAEENLTMHGARDSVPVSPEQGTAEVHKPGVGDISPLDTKTKSR